MDKKFMLLAIREAEKGIRDNDGGPFGVVIVNNGKVVAKGHNTVLKNNDATCHGEMVAIRKASKVLNSYDLSGCDLYTTGKPCPMCKSAIQWAKIKNVYYGCGYDDAGRIGFSEKDGNSKGYTEKKVCGNECNDLYDDYIKLHRRKY